MFVHFYFVSQSFPQSQPWILCGNSILMFMLLIMSISRLKINSMANYYSW